MADQTTPPATPTPRPATTPTQAQPASTTQPLLQEYLFKQTVAFDYVVRRHCKLFANRFETYADAAVSSEHRTYALDDSARLLPDRPEAIQQKKRYLRPPGVGSMTALAAVRGKGAQLELWTFKLKRDEHSDFTFCFQDREQALRWYDTLAQVISALRVAAGKDAIRLPLSPQQQQQQQPAAAGTAPAAEGRDSVGPLPTSPFIRGGGTLLPPGLISGSRTGGVGSGLSAGSGLMVSLPTEDSVVPLMYPLTSHTENEEEEFNRLLHVPTGSTARPQARWVPYRHSNGLAIYRHHVRAADGEPPEYMVSAVIRGSPTEVLRVLMDPHSATTILGPALEVEVLDSSPGKQTLRIILHAEGPNSAYFRPREAIVSRMLKKEEDGVYVVLFHSIDTAVANSRSSLPPNEGVIEVAEGLDERVCRTNPIRCRVSGGYTISKLSGYGAHSSPETLLTCVLQVSDMGGWLNPSHPLFRLVNWWSGGAYEAFLERMLLGVMLVRDMVEKSKFAVTPQIFNTSASEGGAAVPLNAAGQPLVPRSSSVVLRQAASSLSGSSARGAAQAPGSPSARPTSHRIANSSSSPFEEGATRPLVHSQVFQLQQQAVISKVSRLASHRLNSLPSGALLTTTGSQQQQVGGGGPQPAEVAATTSQQQQQQQQQQQWDSSFKLPHKFYEEIHTPGTDCPFKVRGPRYLADGVKVSPGQAMFELLGMEVVNTGSPEPLPHISRFLPSVRRSTKPFLFVWNMIVPGPPTICCVFVFGADSHPDALGPPPDDPEDSDWEPFDFLMWRFLHGNDAERSSLFKMIPRIAEGSWVVKQSVGTTPVIVGRKLTTTYHVTDKYVEVSVDVGSSSTAQYVTGMVRGGCKNLTIDLGVVLEGQHAWELPEVLLGAVRVRRLDLSAASTIDQSKEIPLLGEKPATAA